VGAEVEEVLGVNLIKRTGCNLEFTEFVTIFATVIYSYWLSSYSEIFRYYSTVRKKMTSYPRIFFLNACARTRFKTAQT
jgi:hypothetical protein